MIFFMGRISLSRVFLLGFGPFRLKHSGHPSARTRFLTGSSHVCPTSHTHATIAWLPYVTVVGSHPFASRAIRGCVDARSFLPTTICRPEQAGQGLPRDVRLLITAGHVWPSLHRHWSFLLLPLVTLDGSQPSASTAISGFVVARSFTPTTTFRPEHTEQPIPFVLD